MSENQTALFPATCLAVLSISKHLLMIYGRLSSSGPRRRVGTLSHIYVYPVKSMKGISFTEADCLQSGLRTANVHDRTYMVVAANGTFITARQLPKLATVMTSVEDDVLSLSANGVSGFTIPERQRDLANKSTVTVKVWGEEIEAVDCGDGVAAWISGFLGKDHLRLVYHPHTLPLRHCNEGPTRWHKTAKDDDVVAFQDGFPFMLMSEPSVDDLNRRLKDESVKLRQFRPNIIVRDCEPFAEDQWDDIFIGSAHFKNIKPCQRCVMTTVDPETGIKSGNTEPLVTLRQFRLLEEEFGKSPCFGINLVLVKNGRIRTGDDVIVTFK